MIDARLLQEIVVHTDDRVGVFAGVSRILSDMGIDLVSVSIRADGESAAVHLVTSSQTYASRALRKAGYEISERDVVVLEIPHHPGFLCRISEALARKEITIDELYATAPEEGASAVVVLTGPHNSRAVQLLRGY